MSLLVLVIGSVSAGCGGGGSSGGSTTTTPDPAPVITSTSPATGTVGTELSIVGTDFRSGVQAFVDGIALDSLDRQSSTQLFGFVPAGVTVGTALDVRVRNSDGTEVTLPDAFTAVAPTLSFVNSATKPSGNVGSTVIIEGEAFGDLQGTGEVLFSDGAGGTIAATIASEDDWIDTFIVTTVPSGAEDGPIVVVTATGTSNELPFNVTEAATFSPSTINWTSTAALPVGLSGHEAVFVPIDDAQGVRTNYVHVVGGASNDGVPLAEVNVATIQANGTLGAWAATAPLPAGRAFHTVVVATPFNSKIAGAGEVYVIGGIDTVGGQPLTTVHRATLNEDGTVGDGTAASWTETAALPEPLHSHGVAIFRGAIYVVGGATTDNAPVASVYRARPDEQGELSAWEALTALPSARAYHDVRSFGGFLYSVGGETAQVNPNDSDFLNNDSKLAEIAYVPINLRNGDIDVADWTINANALPKKRSKHSMLVAGGNIFVTSGLYAGAGTGSSENEFAQINSDGSVGSVNGATGSNTLLTEGGANLFNQTAISYIDADGVAHVMVLGGDNVNLPGNKRSGVLFY
ncbi:MAG: hypothetical protein WD672_05655 [Woeseia sp.]